MAANKAMWHFLPPCPPHDFPTDGVDLEGEAPSFLVPRTRARYACRVSMREPMLATFTAPLHKQSTATAVHTDHDTRYRRIIGYRGKDAVRSRRGPFKRTPPSFRPSVPIALPRLTLHRTGVIHDRAGDSVVCFRPQQQSGHASANQPSLAEMKHVGFVDDLFRAPAVRPEVRTTARGPHRSL